MRTHNNKMSLANSEWDSSDSSETEDAKFWDKLVHRYNEPYPKQATGMASGIKARMNRLVRVVWFYSSKLRAGSRSRVVLMAIMFMLAMLQVTVSLNNSGASDPELLLSNVLNNKYSRTGMPRNPMDFRTERSAFLLDEDDFSYNDPDALNLDVEHMEFSEMNMPSFVTNIDTSMMLDQDFASLDCSDLRYHGTVEVSKKFDLELNMKRVRELVLAMGYQDLATVEDTDKSLDRIVKEHWFTFYASSAYLPEYGVHYVARRVIFSMEKRKDRSTVSFVVAQLFDKAWNELPQFEFKNHNPDVETETEVHFFPKVFPMDFVWGTHLYYEGAEDPRVIVRTGPNGDEPIVVYNMKAPSLDSRRVMHGLFPFQNDRSILFTIENRQLQDTEKNWVPFFDQNAQDDDEHKRGFMYFIYGFSPLEVLKCDLGTGNCTQIFTASEKSECGALRGATNLVPLPGNAKLNDGRQVWVGFPRTRIVNCGCGDTTYRPNLMVFVKSGENFYIDLVSGSVDFNLEVMPWDGYGESCSGRNSVLIPNSIDTWEVTRYLGNDFFEDYMTIAFSEADKTSSVLHVKGMLNYIRKIPEGASNKDILDETAFRTAKVAMCAIEDATEYCFKYGQKHGGRILSENELKWGE